MIRWAADYSRPLLTLVVWIVTIGGLACYMSARPQAQTRTDFVTTRAVGDYWLELVLTFEAGPDPFGLPGKDEELPSLFVELAGENIYTQTTSVAAGEVIRISDIPQLLVGTNEFFVSATPLDDDPDKVKAMRVRLWRGDTLLAEESFWSSPGGPAAGTLRCELSNDEPHANDAETHEAHE